MRAGCKFSSYAALFKTAATSKHQEMLSTRYPFIHFSFCQYKHNWSLGDAHRENVDRFRNTIAILFRLASRRAIRASALPLDKIKLPPGFSIDVWAEAPNARGLALGKKWNRIRGIFVRRQRLRHN